MVNPMCFQIPEYILSASVFDLETSIEATMLYMLDNALKHGDNWPELLYGYSWFPKALAKLGDSKRLLRWNWLIAQEPRDPDVVLTEAPRHTFWMSGYAENKIKEDRIIDGGGFKVINYSDF